MDLELQLWSLLFSFLFGFLFSLIVNFHYELLFSTKKWFQIMMNFIFVIDMSLLYFLILKLINGGIIHFYFYILMSVGFGLGYPKTIKLRSILRKLTKH